MTIQSKNIGNTDSAGADRRSIVHELPPETMVKIIDRLIEGRGLKRAVAEANVAADSVYMSIFRNLSTPTFLHEVRNSLQARLTIEGAPPAVEYLVDVASGTKDADKGRTEVVKTLLDRAGVTEHALAASAHTAAPSEMTADQLRRIIETAEAELAARATAVQGAVTRQSDPSPLDFLD